MTFSIRSLIRFSLSEKAFGSNEKLFPLARAFAASFMFSLLLLSCFYQPTSPNISKKVSLHPTTNHLHSNHETAFYGAQLECESQTKERNFAHFWLIANADAVGCAAIAKTL
jgi:hypothetical protein